MWQEAQALGGLTETPAEAREVSSPVAGAATRFTDLGQASECLFPHLEGGRTELGAPPERARGFHGKIRTKPLASAWHRARIRGAGPSVI